MQKKNNSWQDMHLANDYIESKLGPLKLGNLVIQPLF